MLLVPGGGRLVSAGCYRVGPPALGEGAAEGPGQREAGRGRRGCARVGRLPLRRAAVEVLVAALKVPPETWRPLCVLVRASRWTERWGRARGAGSGCLLRPRAAPGGCRCVLAGLAVCDRRWTQR